MVKPRASVIPVLSPGHISLPPRSSIPPTSPHPRGFATHPQPPPHLRHTPLGPPNFSSLPHNGPRPPPHLALFRARIAGSPHSASAHPSPRPGPLGLGLGQLARRLPLSGSPPPSPLASRSLPRGSLPAPLSSVPPRSLLLPLPPFSHPPLPSSLPSPSAFLCESPDAPPSPPARSPASGRGLGPGPVSGVPAASGRGQEGARETTGGQGRRPRAEAA